MSFHFEPIASIDSTTLQNAAFSRSTSVSSSAVAVGGLVVITWSHICCLINI